MRFQIRFEIVEDLGDLFNGTPGPNVTRTRMFRHWIESAAKPGDEKAQKGSTCSTYFTGISSGIHGSIER